MSVDDPFSDQKSEDRTVVRPRPGGRRRGASPRPASSVSASSPGYGSVPSSAVGAHGLNPLVAAANVLLLTAGQLRDTTSHPDPDMLHNLVARELINFENSARSNGMTPEVIFTARYLLCTFMDEIVLSTPWGNQSAWSQQTLLSKFHNEVGGGEKFFQILDKLLQEPSRNLVLLELIYICLALGFRGKYRVQSGGVGQVEEMQHQLMNILRQQRGEIERDLSPHWRGIEDRRNPLARYVPLWVVSAVAVTVLLLLWLGFSMRLSTYSDPVMEELQLLGRSVPPIVERAVVVPKKAPSFSVTRALALEIKQRLVYVNELEDEVSIVVQGEGLFAPARAVLTKQRVPLIEKIALVLERFPGPVLVTGHTDNDPIGGSLLLKFPTNWDLSQKRADAVAALLKANISSPKRVIAEGLADTQPLVANDSPENKARNRRVEITLLLLGEG